LVGSVVNKYCFGGVGRLDVVGEGIGVGGLGGDVLCREKVIGVGEGGGHHSDHDNLPRKLRLT